MAVNIVGLSETNGTVAAQVTTDSITNMSFGSVDSPSIVASSYPIIIGKNSFLKWIRFQLITNNNTSDSAIKVAMTSGSYVTGEVIGGNINSSLGFTPTQLNALTSYGHGPGPITISPFPYSGAGNGANGPWQSFGVTTAQLLVPTVTPAGENIFIGGAAGGSLTVNGTYSNYLIIGNTSTASTPAGAANTKTFTWTYSET